MVVVQHFSRLYVEDDEVGAEGETGSLSRVLNEDMQVWSWQQERGSEDGKSGCLSAVPSALQQDSRPGRGSPRHLQRRNAPDPRQGPTRPPCTRVTARCFFKSLPGCFNPGMTQEQSDRMQIKRQLPANGRQRLAAASQWGGASRRGAGSPQIRSAFAIKGNIVSLYMGAARRGGGGGRAGRWQSGAVSAERMAGPA